MQLIKNPKWDRELIQRYDLEGPRYTSYPTAMEMSEQVDAQQLIDTARATATQNAPLSLYLHLPFCTHVCYFCACNKVITRNKKRALPYLEQLKQEIEQAARWHGGTRRVDQLALGGGTPTFISEDQQRALMGWLRQHFHLRDDDQGDYSIEIDPRELRPDTLPVLRDLGFNRVSFGVQDLEEKVQRAVNRIQPFHLTESVLQQARDQGFRSTNLDLIYGLPLQTIASFERTLARVIDLAPDRISIFNYAHLPDRFRSQRHIDASQLPSPQEKLQIMENNVRQLSEAGYVYIGMDHFAKPEDELAIAQQSGQLHRNFQGYTTHGDCDLVSMGVSAISQIGDVYYQNHHDLGSYQSLIEGQEHAVNRGFILSFDDKLRRQVIKQLICHCELDMAEIAQRFDISFHSYFKSELETLSPMVKDGLVEIDDQFIRVSAVGRLLIRRICMVFDKYLPQHLRGVFSKII